MSVAVRYKYSGDRKLRARRYAANQNSAQKCARRIQTQLYGHTTDLDIENCCVETALYCLIFDACGTARHALRAFLAEFALEFRVSFIEATPRGLLLFVPVLVMNTLGFVADALRLFNSI